MLEIIIALDDKKKGKLKEVYKLSDEKKEYINVLKK